MVNMDMNKGTGMGRTVDNNKGTALTQLKQIKETSVGEIGDIVAADDSLHKTDENRCFHPLGPHKHPPQLTW